MGRIAIRRVEYVGDRYEFTSQELPDGLVIVEGKNGTGKTTFADLIYFALGGRVKKFAKSGSERHKEIASDSNNFVRLTIEIAAQRYTVTRRFATPDDILVLPAAAENALVFPVTRRDDRKIFSDWVLDLLGISTVPLYSGYYSGKLNFTDALRLIYHDQDPDPRRVFKKLESDNFVSDSSEFRRAIFEILIGQASEEFYDAVGKLKQSEALLAQRTATLAGYKAVVVRASAGREDANAHFLREAIEEREKQVGRLERTRAQLRKTAPNASADDTELLGLRRKLTEVELEASAAETGARDTTSEEIRLRSLEAQIIDEVVRIQKIIHAHEALALFSPDTCPCCLRKADRAKGRCICGNPIDEVAYQRFFYSPEEYVAILKSKQKNVETVRAAIEACQTDLRKLGPLGNAGTLIAFRLSADDAIALEPEFEPELVANDLARLGRYEIALKLCVDGVTSEPFTGTALGPLAPLSA